MATALQMPEYNRPSYQTVPLEEYSTDFQALAHRAFQRISEITGTHQAKAYRGSYSILATTSSATVAKIIIYESAKGKTNGNWPDLRDGVYALIRANHEALRSVKSIQRNRPRAHIALKNANKEVKAALSRWETAYNKENFYRGIRILLELQRNGSSAL